MEEKSLSLAQIDALTQFVRADEVKERQAGGGKVNYLEANYVIDVMNEIFGYDGWNYEIVSQTYQVYSNPVDANVNVTGFDTRLRLYVYGKLRAEECVFSYINAGEKEKGQRLADAVDNAKKGGVSDALKRCCRSLGHRFGNGLYDTKALDKGQPRSDNPSNRPHGLPLNLSDAERFIVNVGVTQEKLNLLVMDAERVFANATKENITATYETQSKLWTNTEGVTTQGVKKFLTPIATKANKSLTSGS